MDLTYKRRRGNPGAASMLAPWGFEVCNADAELSHAGVSQRRREYHCPTGFAFCASPAFLRRPLRLALINIITYCVDIIFSFGLPSSVSCGHSGFFSGVFLSKAPSTSLVWCSCLGLCSRCLGWQVAGFLRLLLGDKLLVSISCFSVVKACRLEVILTD